MRAVLADGPADHPFGTYRQVVVHLHCRQYLRPHRGLPVIDHHNLQQAGIEHLENVLVLERVGQQGELDWRFAGGAQALV
ncbi:hypothetical protein D3C72_2292970 [compost metagenome]